VTVLAIRGVHKVHGKGASAVPAVRGVDLDVAAGETVALVGESGCGKSTLGRVVAGLQPSSGGEVLLDGQPLGTAVAGKGRRRVQMVFQHPPDSLNPSLSVEAMLSEPLRLLMGLDGASIRTRVTELLVGVGLTDAHRQRKARQLSGGQQQRVAIARALACQPELVVLDEPTASLDQSVRARIVALLRDIQQRENVAYLFITHDLDTVGRLADRVAVMYLGRIVELAPTAELFTTPAHHYTRALLSAVPRLDPAARQQRVVLPGETPNPSNLPTGCSFQDRCPAVHDRCRREDPVLLSLGGGRSVACFAPLPTHQTEAARSDQMEPSRWGSR
jgi:oligopeptide/dipeptide ABC transporter ATP-binding protein